MSCIMSVLMLTFSYRLTSIVSSFDWRGGGLWRWDYIRICVMCPVRNRDFLRDFFQHFLLAVVVFQLSWRPNMKRWTLRPQEFFWELYHIYRFKKHVPQKCHSLCCCCDFSTPLQLESKCHEQKPTLCDLVFYALVKEQSQIRGQRRAGADSTITACGMNSPLRILISRM